MEAWLGCEKPFRTTSPTSLVVANNPEVSAPGVTLRAFWKHMPCTVHRFRTQGGTGGSDHRGLSWKDLSESSWFKPLIA